MTPNPQMLRLAREALALTQTALAERGGFEQADVSRWERGIRSPSPTQLQRLADTLDLPAGALCAQDRLTEPVHRTARIESKRLERKVDARLELARLVAGRILRDIDIQAPYSFPTIDEAGPADPEEAAAAVRRVWGIPKGPVGNLTDYVEGAGAIVLRVDFGTDSVVAAYSHLPGDHRFCFINTRVGDGARARFSLAHELGHAILHWDRFDAPVGKDAEREAHRFAAALFMPRDEILQSLRRTTIGDLLALSGIWKVSIQALITRAHELGVISKDQRTRLYKQVNARGWARRSPTPVPLEQPATMIAAMQVHRNEHRYDDEELALLAGLPEHRLADLMPDYFRARAPRLRLVSQR